MEPYKILEKNNDLKIKVYGKTPEELFTNSALVMADILSGGNKKIENGEEGSIIISSFDINSLLIDFLERLLTESYAKKKIFLVSSINVFDNFLESKIISYPIEIFKEKIRAVTYEKLNIEEKRGRWQTQLVFDL